MARAWGAALCRRRRVLGRLDAAGCLLGVATGRVIPVLRSILAEHGLTRRFITLQTADRNPGKPAPGMLFAAMAAVGAAAADTYMVGDTTYDIQMAVTAGVTPVGVSRGYPPVGELLRAGANTVIDGFAELPRTIGV